MGTAARWRGQDESPFERGTGSARAAGAGTSAIGSTHGIDRQARPTGPADQPGPPRAEGFLDVHGEIDGGGGGLTPL